MYDIKIIEGESAGKFFIQLKENEASLKYRMKDKDTIEYVSTFVPPEYRGKIYAGNLVKFALEYARKNKLRVIATCSYVKNFINENKDDYKDLDIEL